MIDKNKPAYPFVPNQQQMLPDGTWDQNCESGDSGMTLRQYYAAKADIPWNVAMETLMVQGNESPSISEIITRRTMMKFMEADEMIAFENIESKEKEIGNIRKEV